VVAARRLAVETQHVPEVVVAQPMRLYQGKSDLPVWRHEVKHTRRADDSYKLRVFNLWRGESTSACRLLVSFSTCGRVGTTRVSGGPAGCCFPCCAFFRRSDRPVLGRCWARASDFSGRPGRTLGVADASLLFARLRVLMDRWRAKFLHSGQVELLARGRKRRGCSLFSATTVTASKSTPPSVCLGSFPPFQGVGKNKFS